MDMDYLLKTHFEYMFFSFCWPLVFKGGQKCFPCTHLFILLILLIAVTLSNDIPFVCNEYDIVWIKAWHIVINTQVC